MPLDFEFTEEQNMFRDTAREFGKNEIEPLIEEYEKEEDFPKELFPKLGEMGFLGIVFPEEYGGVGLDKVTDCIFAEEMGNDIGASLSGLRSTDIVRSFSRAFFDQHLRDKKFALLDQPSSRYPEVTFHSQSR